MTVEFQKIDGVTRSVYRQLNGSIELADVCSCEKDPYGCPIDEHRIRARQKELQEEIE